MTNANEIWKDFPEINRKVAFQSNYIPVDGASLGCHCGTISGVSVTFAGSYHAANNGRNIEILDTTKEGPIEYNRAEYDRWIAPAEELKKVLKYLEDTKIKLADFDTSLYMSVVERCKAYPLWVMSDVINYEAPVRKPSNSVLMYRMVGTTGDFAQYLIDNKIGYIMASPIVQNPSHRTSKTYSLNRGWFWIPPNHMDRAIDVAEIHGGGDNFPTKEEWINTVGPDIGMKGADPDKILKAVLNDGVFPEDKRFKRETVKEA